MSKKKKEEFNDRVYGDIMVDLETLSTETDAQVVSIGAVRFRLDTVDDVDSIMEKGRSFYSRLCIQEQEDTGRHVDPSTIEWWSNQSKAARAVFEEPEEDVGTALDRFTKFCRGAKRIWGNGNMFDNAIVRNLYDDFGRRYPVDYWQDLDVRTLTYLWNSVTNWVSKGKRPTIVLGEEHNALDDARRQVIQCQLMMKDIKGSKYES